MIFVEKLPIPETIDSGDRRPVGHEELTPGGPTGNLLRRPLSSSRWSTILPPWSPDADSRSVYSDSSPRFSPRSSLVMNNVNSTSGCLTWFNCCEARCRRTTPRSTGARSMLRWADGYGHRRPHEAAD